MVYDRAGVAKRIRQRRKELGMSSAEVAGKIGRAVHYYGDIERGTCGMSIETLLDLAHYLDLSVDYILFGQAGEERIDNPDLAYRILKKYDEKTQKEAIEMMKFYLCLRESGKKSKDFCSASSGGILCLSRPLVLETEESANDPDGVPPDSEY